MFPAAGSLVKLARNKRTDRAADHRNSMSRALPFAQVLSRFVRGRANEGKRFTAIYRRRKIPYRFVVFFKTKKLDAMNMISE